MSLETGVVPRDWLVGGATLLSAVLCAAATVMLAPVSRREGPLRLVGVQAGLAVLGLLVLALVRLGWRGLVAIDWLTALILLCGVAPLMGGGAVLLYMAVDTIRVSRAFPIASSYPLFTALAAVVFLGERPTIWTTGGTAAIVLGISIISVGRASADRDLRVQGPLLCRKGFWYALLAAVCWTGSNSLMKVALARGIDLLLGNLLRMPGIAVLTVLALRMRKETVPLWVIGRRSWAAILAATFLDRIVGDVLYVWALQAGTLSAQVPLAATAPAWTVLLAGLFLRERLSWALVVGLLLSVGGTMAIVA